MDCINKISGDFQLTGRLYERLTELGEFPWNCGNCTYESANDQLLKIFSREVLINDGCFGHEAERIDNRESPRQQDEGETGAKSESNEPRTKLEANSEEKVVPNRSRPITDTNERMTNNAGTNSELNARVTQVSNSNGSTDTMALMTRIMEMVQQQIVQQTAQSAMQQQLTELLIDQQRESQERHNEMIQWQQQTQKDMIEAMRVTKQEPQNIGTGETDVVLERLTRVHKTIGGMERNATSYGNGESAKTKAVPINDEKPNIPTASFNVNTEHNVRSKTMRACVFCNKDHFSDKCKTMADVGSRRIAASKGGRCFKCLRKGHMARDCQRTKACFHCGKEGHHSALCLRREEPMNSKRETHQLLNDNAVEYGDHEEETQMVNELEVSMGNLTSTDVVMEGMLTQQESNDDHIVMAMFPAQAVNPETGESVVINVYLDSGAKRTCIDAQAAKQLNLRAKQELVLETSRFNTKKKENVNAELVELVLKGKDGYTLPMKVFSVTQLAPPMTIKPMRCSRQVWEAIERHNPVHKPSNRKESRPIHLLVGLDYWYAIMGLNVSTTPLCEGQQLVIHHTPLGNYVLCGRLTNDNGEKNERSETMMADIQREPTSDSGGVKPTLNVEQLICNVAYTSNEMMQRIWRLDGIGTNEPKPSGKMDSFPTQHGTANDQAFSESLLIVNASWPD